MPLFGISERYSGFKAWDTFITERTIHNHYFNTYINERKLLYERYYISYTTRNIQATNELIYDYRNISFSSFNLTTDNKNIYLYYKDTVSTERNISKPEAIPPITTEYTDERTSVTSSYKIQSSDRSIFIEIFYCDERKIYTIPKNPIFSSDQRFCLMWLDLILFNERIISFNSYSFGINFQINDINPNIILSKEINDNEYDLLKNKITYPETYVTKYNLVEIETSNVPKNADLFLIYENPNTQNYESVNFTLRGTVKVPSKLLTDDSLLDGFILFNSSPIYIRISPILRKTILNEEPNEFLNRVKRQNLLLIKINNDEVDLNDIYLLHRPPHQLYQFYIYMEKSIKKFFKYFKIIWYYPFSKRSKKNTVLLKII